MIKKLLLLQGISGSGKTTFAKQWAEEDPIHRVRLNYDDLRCMFGKYWVPERESLMTETFNHSLATAMYMGYDIVIDNMSNLNPKHIKEYEKIVSEHNETYPENYYEIEFKLFNTPVEECVRRDALRPIPIGETVIKQQWRRYRDFIIQQSIKEMLDNQIPPDKDLPECIIVDMDATLCFNTSQRPFFGKGAAEKMKDDTPNIPICSLVRNYCDAADCALIIVTGRDESCREVTMQWLDDHWLHPTKLLMRPLDNYTSGEAMKKYLYETYIEGKYNVNFVVEDSSKVVAMYRNLGLTVLQPNEGKF